MDMSAMLPVWIIGAPLVFAIIDKFMTPSVIPSGAAYNAGVAGRPLTPPATTRVA